MTSRIPENFSLVDRSLITSMSSTMPPRDPDDDDDDEEEQDDEVERQDEPAVIREPDEDE
jgi:hypothetical protein